MSGARKPPSPWKRLRYRLEAALLKMLAAVIPLLSRKMLVRLANFLGWTAFHLLGSERDIALTNLDLAFGSTKSAEEKRRIAASLAEVGLPESVARMYPHELSGGMKQRACIAIAICLRPMVIIADEPTSALDVVVQRQVMATLARVQQELGAAVILVGHDMGLMAQFVDRLAVMYAGRLVEVAPIAEIITRPRHPYTRALIGSLPSLEKRGALAGIPGLAPPLRDLPRGCAFHPRCTLAVDRCRTEKPKLRDIDGCQVACHLA